jgi:CRISPR system Cascade subunit CasD
MDTLLIRLVAPMQSWGVQSRYTVRDSGLEPSKSGVIGLLCAALGRPREAPVDDLAALRMGVRVDREGSLRSDYHIAQDVLDSDGKKMRKSVVTTRYYLADAAFLVGLEGERRLLEAVQTALQHPVWAIYLGRKAFVPSQPVWLKDGVKAGSELEPALQSFGWIVRPPDPNSPQKVRYVIETSAGREIRPDVPISFAQRRFSSRRVNVDMRDAPMMISAEVM